MTGKELKNNLVSEDKDTVRKTEQALMKFSKSLKGTRQDLANLANKSLAYIEWVRFMTADKAAYNIFLTLSAADLHWDTFHRAFPDAQKYLDKHLLEPDNPIGSGDADLYISKTDDYLKRQKLVNENGPMFNYYFCRQWELLIEYVLKKKLGLKDFFVRFEFQNRTVIHLHSFLFIPCNISADEVKLAFSWARDAQLEGGPDNTRAVDEWMNKVVNKKFAPKSNDNDGIDAFNEEDLSLIHI